MKILVTGANGYLGQGVVKALLNNGHNVIAADFKTTYVDDRAERVDCDLFSIEDPYIFLVNQMFFFIWRGEMDLYIIRKIILRIYQNTIIFETNC